MIYWKIRIDSDNGKDGWLVFDENMTALRLTDEDGNDLIGNVDYTTIDTEASPPEWA
jgi:hypothetical protein